MNLFNSISSYFQGVAVEVRKVVWPSFPSLVRYLVSVVLGIALATVFIGAVDYIFYHLLSFFISK
jgi:preprotein translocase SecE subunit